MPRRMPRRSRPRALRPAPSVRSRRLLRKTPAPLPCSVLVPAPIDALARQRLPLRRRVAPGGRLPAPGDPPAPAAPAGEPAALTQGQLLLPGFAPVPASPRIAAPVLGAREALADYPDVPASALCRHAKRLGKSAELLVDSLFMRLGERVYPADEHEAYDRLLWLPEGQLRVQIKARHRRTGDTWLFSVMKGYQRGPIGTRPYDADDFDLLALVILPEGVVKFTVGGAARHRIHQREVAGLRACPRDSLDAALRALGFQAAVPQRPGRAAA